MNPASDDRLRAELLELYFDCHEDPEPLLARIAAEPEVAALFERVREEAACLAEAARDEARTVSFAPPSARRRSWRRPVVWTAAAAAVLLPLVPFLAGAWAEHRARSLERDTLRLVVTGPVSTADAAPSSFRAETWTRDGEPRTATLAWRVRGADGRVLLEREVASKGAVDLAIPPHLEAGGSLEVTARGDGHERTATLPLGAAERTPLAHLTVDKAIYRPGEPVRLRAVLLDRLSLAPIDAPVRLRVVDAAGAPVTSIHDRAAEGVVASVVELSEEAVGGTWAVELRDAHDRFTVERRTFQVRRFQAPRLDKTLVLDRESYAPGETGSASLEVTRLAGGAAAFAEATVLLVVDGETVSTLPLVLDGEGRATATFTIPAEVERGEARLVARVEDRGVVETTLEPFVVPTGRVDVAFHPEGGDLIAGVANRVYAEVTDPLGRPVAATGTVVDDTGRAVAEFETLHQGRARFLLTPERGRSYRLAFDVPKAEPAPLPLVREQGVTLGATVDSYAAGAPLTLLATTDGTGPWMVGAFCRGVLVAQDAFSGAGRQTVSLDVPPEIAGVLRVTLFDATLTPRAERLVHRASGRDLRVDVTPLEPRLAPGEQQRVLVKTTDGRGAPVRALVGLTVTDRSVLDLAGEDRIGLADQAWLACDVRELEDAGEFLGGGADAARNVDLLLGTRGWRRFAWADADDFLARHGDEARALLAMEAADARPRAVDTGGKVSEELATLHRDARRLGKTAKDLFLIVFGTVGLLLLALSTAAMARRVAPRLRFVGPIAAVAAVAVVLGLLRQSRERFVAREMVQWDAFLAGAAAPLEGKADRVEIMLDAAAPMEPAADLAELGYAGGEVEEEALEVVAFDDGAGDFLADQGLVADRFADARGRAGERNEARRQVVREYAHRNPRGSARSDFTETVYWHPSLVTDDDGMATVEFDVSDAATTWVAFADAHGGGSVGQGTVEFDATLPFRLLPKLPTEVTEGDRLELPIALVSDDPEIASARLHVETLGPIALDREVAADVVIEGGGGRVLVPVTVGSAASAADGDARLIVSGDAGRFGDRIERSIRVVPRGFPQRISRSGLVTDRVTFRVDLPAESTKGSVRTSLTLYPSPLADLVTGLDGMLREPRGCFEQASSSNYPNVLALAYLDAAGGDDPAFERRARDLLERGYAKITGYECPGRGYEWFGGDPGHEALTAYGLLEFHDMARVFDVDREMVDRTRDWVLARRDGKGGFERNARALDAFGSAPSSVTDAYVTYALAVTGADSRPIEEELDRLARRVAESDDPYELALAALALATAGRDVPADAARERLKTLQRDDGSLVGKTTSITSSRGNDLAVETTGWAAQAWLEDPSDRAAVERAVEFLLRSRTGAGTFGATQATIVALQTLTAYATSSRRTAHDGAVRLLVNGLEIETLTFRAGHTGALPLAPFEHALRPGPNELVIELTGDNEFPWSFDLAYHSDRPADHEDGAVAVETRLGSSVVAEGETVPLHVRVTNRTDGGLPMTLAIVGLPAGLEADPKILDDLKAAGRFDLWEQDGRDVILYWRSLPPRATRDVTLDAVATVPGTTTGPASRAYLYYTPDQKRWAEPLQATVTPAGHESSALPQQALDLLVKRCEVVASNGSLDLGAALTWARETAWAETVSDLAAARGEREADVEALWRARPRGAPLGRATYGSGTFVLGVEKATRDLPAQATSPLPNDDDEGDWWEHASLPERTSFLVAFITEHSGPFEFLRPESLPCPTCAGTGQLDFFGSNDPTTPAARVTCHRCKGLTLDRVAVFR